MADLSYIQSTLETKIVGQNSTGVNMNYVGADSNGNMFVKDYSDGPVSPGTAASTSMLMGGQYNSALPTLTSTQQSAIQLDSSGRVLINMENLNVNYTAGVSSTGNLFTQTGLLNYNSFVFAITGTFVATITAKASNDGTTYFTIPVVSLTNLNQGPITAITVPDYYYIPINFQWLIITVSSYTSGTVNFNGYESTSNVKPVLPDKTQLQDNSGNGINSISNALNVNTKSPRTFSAPTTASVGTSSTTILAANASRAGLYLTNTTAYQISLGFNGNAAAYQNGITLFPGETFWMDEYSFSTGAVSAISSVATYIGVQEIT